MSHLVLLHSSDTTSENGALARLLGDISFSFPQEIK